MTRDTRKYFSALELCGIVTGMNLPLLRQPERHFLGWSQPAVALIAQRVTPLVEAEPLIVVPTKEAARLLKEQIAIQAAASTGQGASLSPRIIPSNHLLKLTKPPYASPVEELICWQRALRHAASSHRNELFASSGNWSEQSWLYQAQQLQELFATLSRDGVHWQDSRLQEITERERRWECLLALKSQQAAYLAELGYAPSQQSSSLDLAAHTPIILACVPQLSIQLQQLLAHGDQPVEVWIHAPEAQHAAFDAWGCPREAWLSSSLVTTSGLSPERWAENIVLSTDTWTMAQQAVLRLGLINAQESGALHSVALCNIDPETEACLEETLAQQHVTVHRPRGRSFRSSAWYHLLTQLSLLQRELSHRHIPLDDHGAYPSELIIELMSNPIINRLLHTRSPGYHGERQALLLSHIQARSFPTRLAGILQELQGWTQHYPREARLQPHADSLLITLEQLCHWLQSSLSTPTRLLQQLLELSEHSQPATKSHSSVSDSIQQSYTLLMVSLCEELLPLLKKQQGSIEYALALLLLLSEKQRAPPARSDEASLDIMGWRDLAYSSARHLVISSFHDGILPERWSVQPWLTPQIRQELGLRRDIDYAAHDAYLLQSILATRPGRVSFFLSLSNAKGDPLAPSSLFFKLCPREQLAALVSYLFTHPESAISTTQPQTLPQWHYRQIANLQDIPLTREALAHASLSDFGQENPITPARGYSPSLLKSFLTCPLRFWLRELYHIDTQKQENKKRELNAADLGNVIHDALEAFIRLYPDYGSYHRQHPYLPPSPSELSDEHIPQLRQSLTQQLEQSYTSHYPNDSLLPQQLQYSSLRDQIAAYAPIHLQLWKEGWSTARDEQGDLLVEYRPDWTWGEHRMNVKIDRIDWREGPMGLEMRVLDYKTGSLDSCAKKHLTPLHEEKDQIHPQLLSPRFEHPHAKKKDQPQRWTDLQLPLYAAWVEQHFTPLALSAGYIKLSRRVEESGLILWESSRDHHGLFDEYDLASDEHAPTQQLFDNAKAWIRGSIELISSGRCLVSAELMGWSVAYDALFADIATQAPLHELFIQAPSSSQTTPVTPSL